MKNLLIIEDDQDLREGLAFSMENEGFLVFEADTLAKGFQQFKESPMDFVILDCNLPDGTGYDFCRQIRKTSQVPILMLTARDTEMDEIQALERGADDYMSKPFSLAVLKARVKKLIRPRGEAHTFYTNGFLVDRSTCRVSREGRDIPLSAVEYRLLVYLMENKGQILSKEQILAHVWDCAGRFVEENAVSVNIRRLRRKIEDNPEEPVYIQNVRGMGYIWKER